MWALSVCRGAILVFSVALLLVAGICYCDDKMVEVVGTVECTDCMQNNIKSRDIFAGLQVSIECAAAGGVKTRGVGKLDEEGKFKVILPMVKDDHGKQLEECFAKLIHGAGSNVHACPMSTENVQQVSSKIILIKPMEEENNMKHYTFSPAGKLAFSALTCSLSSSSTTRSSSSNGLKDLKFLPLHKLYHPWLKPLPKFHIPVIPPKVIHKKPVLPLLKKKPLLKKPFLITPISKKPFFPPIPKENQKFLIKPKIPHILKRKFIHHHLPKFVYPIHKPHFPPKHFPHH